MTRGTPTKRAAAAAARQLRRATNPLFLWVTQSEVVAPPYGAQVFAETAAALSDLDRVPPLKPLGQSIVAADRAIAQGALALARGADPNLLASARRHLSAGEREAAAGHRRAAARSYANAWKDAYAAMARLAVQEVTGVPSAALTNAAENALGSKRIGLSGPIITQGQPPLTADGKPEVFFAGSEACPFCGVQRWGMIVALAQFGTFSNLHTIQSTASEFPTVSTFTFFGSSYQSPYITFVPVEALSNVPGPIGFVRLQHLTPAEQALVERYDPRPQVPFIDVDNHFITAQSTVLPELIGRSLWPQIGHSLTNPASIPAQAVAGEAEVLTAEICESTGGNPSSICSRQVVHDYEAALPRLNGKGGGCPAAMDTAARRRGAALGSGGPVATGAHCHR